MKHTKSKTVELFIEKKYLRIFFASFFGILFLLIVFTLVFKPRLRVVEYYQPKQVENISDNFEGEVSFNSFGRDESFRQVFIDSINKAQTEIFVAMYSLSDNVIVQALNEKQKEGVKVVVILPGQQRRMHDFIFTLTEIKPIYVGVPLEEQSSQGNMEYESISDRGLMHHKFIIIDPHSENKELVWSSSNATELQFKHDPGFVMKTADAFLVQNFYEEFQRLQKGTSSLKKLRQKEFSPFAFLGNYQNGFLEIWFGPGYLKNSLKERTLTSIHDATQSITILGWRLNDRNILDALLHKAHEGIEVTIVLDDYYLWNAESIDATKLLQNEHVHLVGDSFSGIQLLLKEFPIEQANEILPGDVFNPFLHHHTFIIDDKLLITGTNNWTQGGFFTNDESSIVTNVPEIVATYKREATELVNWLQGERMPIIVDGNIFTIGNVVSIVSPKYVVIFDENVGDQSLGSVCQTYTYKANAEYIVPKNCLNASTKILLLDQDNHLMGSTYYLTYDK